MIEKITAEEFDKLPARGWGRSSVFLTHLKNLKAGEGLKVLKTEWRSRSKTPSAKCRYMEKRYKKYGQDVKYVCIELADRSGWAIKRVQ